MSALVGYGSSDDDDDTRQIHGHDRSINETSTRAEQLGLRGANAEALANGSSKPTLNNEVSSSVVGDMMGPAGPPQAVSSLETDLDVPASPYTIQQSTIRNLTLPTNPNFDIPPSPPGSPNPGAEDKFAHFLELKKQGVHFNAKLASSASLKNPSLLPKLMHFAGVEDQRQYQTTLPMGLWDPSGFPEFAYKEELGKSQQEISKKKDEEATKNQRDSIDFVPTGNLNPPSSGETPGTGVGSKTAKGSAAERVMAGLDRDRKASTQAKR